MPASDARHDYETLLDAEYLAYVRRVNAFFPPNAATLPLDEQRRLYRTMCEAFHPGRPATIAVSDIAIDGPGGLLPLRLYRCGGPDRGRILFFHGGGFVFGDLDSHDDTCGDLCAATGLDLVSVDYRLAPEHTHPAAFQDAWAAFDWMRKDDGRPIVLVGESAGGTVAASVAHAARVSGMRPAGQVLIYPQLGGEPGRSHRIHANAPLLSAAEVEFYRAIRAGGEPPTDDPTFEPLADTDYAGLPPTIVVTAECDPLSSEGEAYCARIVAAGGAATWREEAGLTHSFMRARATVPRAAQAFLRLVEDIRAMASV